MVERARVHIDSDKVLRIVDRIEELFERKRKGRCSAEIHLEEYSALRFLVLWYEIGLGCCLVDDAGFVAQVKAVIAERLAEFGRS